MPELTRAGLTGLIKLSLASPQELHAQVRVILDLLENATAAGDENECDTLLAAGLDSLSAAEETGVDARTVADAAGVLGREAEKRGRPTTAREAYAFAVRLLDPATAGRELGVRWHDIGDTWEAEDEHAQAAVAYEKAADFKVHAGDEVQAFLTLGALAKAQEGSGPRGSCIATLARALQALARISEPDAVEREAIAAGAINATALAQRLEESAIARDLCLRSARLLDPAKQQAELGVLWDFVGDTWRAEEEPTRAVEAYRLAVTFHAAEHGASQLIPLQSLIEVLAELGAREDRDTTLAQAIELLSDPAVAPKGSGLPARALKLGRLAEACGHREWAREAYARALTWLEEGSDRYGQGVIWHDIGDTWRTEQNLEQAREAYRRAAELKSEGDNFSDRVATERALIEMLSATQADQEAVTRISAALNLARARWKGEVDRERLATEVNRLSRIADGLSEPDLARDAHELAGVIGGAEPGARVRWGGW